MTIHYYFSWFDEELPENLIQLLDEDLVDRKSLVMISGQPTTMETSNRNIVTDIWLSSGGIIFEESHLIDYRTSKEEAYRLIQQASAIFLCGGSPVSQQQFLVDYGLSEVLKKSTAVIMGASAGAINMSAEWLCSKNMGMNVETSTTYPGLGLDNLIFCSKPNLSMTDTALLKELLPLSNKRPIYAAVNEGAIRIKGQEKMIIGDVYLIVDEHIQKLVAESSV